MKAVQISKPGCNFEMVERPVPEPGRGQVRIKVEACGVCHSDTLVKEGQFPGLQYPRVPGHEIAGRIDAVGADVMQWKPGQRVGVGWHGGHCFQCDPCRRGDFILCQFEKITAIHFDGGYAEYMIAPAEAVALMPDDLPAAEAAPLMCAGITVFNSLRNAGAQRRYSGNSRHWWTGASWNSVRPADGLSHRRGWPRQRQRASRRKLGAHEYVDAGTSAPADALQKLGGARVILAATAPDSKSISALVYGLAAGEHCRNRSRF